MSAPPTRSPDLREASYREIGPLASGGMAELFEAERDDGTAVVIKRIRPAFVFDDTYRALFFDEGQVQQCIDHPSVVQLLDRGEDDRGPYLVFERVFGTDLGIVLDSAFTAERPLEVAQVLAIFIPLFDALACVHQACAADGACLDVIHRDISPGNILLSEGGEVKLADFGVAKSALKTQHTVVGEMKGKFAYMAPEQTRGVDVGPKADLFAAGIVLYECLTGKRLFDGPCDLDVVQAVRDQDVVAPSECRPDLDTELCALTQSLLEKDESARPASAADVAEALRDIAMNLCLDTGHKRQVSRLARAHPRVIEAAATAAADHRRKTQRVMGAVPHGPVVVSESKPTLPLTRVAAFAAIALGVAGVIFVASDSLSDAAKERPSVEASSVGVDGRKKTTANTAKDRTPPEARGAATATEPTAPLPSASSPTEKALVPRSKVATAKESTTAAPLAPDRKRTVRQKRVVKAKAGQVEPQKPPLQAQPKVVKTSPRRPVLQPVAEKGREKTVAMAAAPAPKAEGFGKLFLAAEPWARVYVDGSLLSTTPINGARLSAGRHTVDIENPVYKIKKRLIIVVPKDGEVRRFVDLTKR